MDGRESPPTLITKRFKRFRSRRQSGFLTLSGALTSRGGADGQSSPARVRNQPSELKELIFLRDIHFGFLPDNCEQEFSDCFAKLSTDEAFAWKVLKLGLLSRNEDLVCVLLDHLVVTRRNFEVINANFLDALLLEAVELDDLESIECILSWRDVKAKRVGLTHVDKRLLRMQRRAQEVIITAAIKNNYPIVKVLFHDGYRIFQLLAEDRFFFSRDAKLFQSYDVMERHIERIRVFKAVSSPAYMALTYEDNPVDHALNFIRKASLGMQREPEFRRDFEEVQQKCQCFAVSLLDSCRNSHEVELVLDDPDDTSSSGSRPRRKPQFKRIYRALCDEQKEFVAHSFCQLVLHHRWAGSVLWSSKNWLQKIVHVLFMVAVSPILCPIYALSPYRDHEQLRRKTWFTSFLRQLDCPLNRLILDIASHAVFLGILGLSVVYGVGDHSQTRRTLFFDLINVWVGGSIFRCLRISAQRLSGQHIPCPARYVYDCITYAVFLVAIVFKNYAYEVSLKQVVGSGLFSRVLLFSGAHPINVGANVYGIACCLAFLRLIFIFEIHHRFGPILYCIKQVFWDIMSVIGAFLIAVAAFGVGLDAIYGIYSQDQTDLADFDTTIKKLFWIIFDPGKEETADIRPHPNLSAWSSSPLLTLPRHAIPPNPNASAPGGKAFATVNPHLTHTISHNVGHFIWGFYQVLVVLIMMNLLISLMTSTFSRIQRNADVEWKFTRASIWIYFYDDWNCLPVPFNVIPSVHSMRQLYHICRKFWAGKHSDDAGDDCGVNERHQMRRQNYNVLIERVFRMQEKKQERTVSRADIEALEKEIAIDIAELKRDVRMLRRDIQVHEEELSPEKPFKRRVRTSFKHNNNPEHVEHLVHTLGLLERADEHPLSGHSAPR